MMRKILIGALLALCVVFFGGAWFFSNIIIHFKQRTLEEDRSNLKYETVADEGLPVPESVRIDDEFLNAVDAAGQASEAVPIGAWYFANPGAGDCAVIVHHGHTGTRWGAIKYAPLFWKRGCSILSVDARYHGESGGDCGSYGYHERYDLQRAIAWLQKKTGLNKNQIGLMGESMGAAIVTMTAPLEPELAFVAADSPYGDLAAVLAERGGMQYSPALIAVMLPAAMMLADLRCDMNASEVAPKDSAKGIRIPVFLSHSASDAGTLPYHSESIYDNVPHERKTLHINEWNAPHARDINLRYEDYEAHMDAFLLEYVPDFGR